MAVLGEVASSCSSRGGTVCQQNQVPMISPSSTNPRLTEKGDYIFRACFTDNFQGAAVAHFAYDQGYKTAAVFKDITSDYSVVFARIFVKEFERLGRQGARRPELQATIRTFALSSTRSPGGSPTPFLCRATTRTLAHRAPGARDRLDVPLLGGDGWASAPGTAAGGTLSTGATS